MKGVEEKQGKRRRERNGMRFSFGTQQNQKERENLI